MASSSKLLEASDTLTAHLDELEARTHARRSLLSFTTYTFPLYRPEPVHELLAETLDRLVTGDCKRLMISAPPQVGKSQLASVSLPAFWLGRRPDEPIILTSYAASLAYSKSRQEASRGRRHWRR